MHVKTIHALWRAVLAARAHRLGEAVDWFTIAHNCAVWRRRRAQWNLDAVLRRVMRAAKGSRREPLLESLVELERVLLSKPARPGHSRRLFDRLWTMWCTRAYRTEPEWAYQAAGK